MMKYKVRVERDHDHDARDADRLGTIVCWHRRYRLGDVQPSCDPQEWRETFDAERPDAVILPVYMYEHGSIALSCSSFSDRWDSGQLGWIYVTREKLDKERIYEPVYPAGCTSEEKRKVDEERFERVEALLRSEVRAYSDCIEGNVWGYRIFSMDHCATCGHADEVEVESCWGFVGDDAPAGMREYIPSEHWPLLDEAWEQRFDG